MPRGNRGGADTAKPNRVRQVERLTAKGKSIREIAEMLELSERRVSQLRAEAKDMPSGELAPKQFASSIASMDADTPEAFEEFFVTYSEFDYLPKHLKIAVAHALGSRYSMVNIPPRHAKSEIFSVWLPLWLIARDRDVQIIVLSKTEKLAKKFANSIAYHLTSNEGLIRDWGIFRPDEEGWPWRPNSGELMVAGRRRAAKSGDLTLQVRGSGQQVLGFEADRLIVDDVTDRSVAISESERNRELEWLRGDVMTRLSPGGSATVVGQRVHTQDLYGELQKMTFTKGPHVGEPIFSVHVLPAILDWDAGETLWPELWTFEELSTRAELLGSALFSTMFQQDPQSDSGTFVLPSWIYGDVEAGRPGCLDHERDIGQGHRLEGGQYLPVARVISIDPSPTRYAGMVVADVLHMPSGPTIGVVELRSKKQTMREMRADVEDLISRYAPISYIIFEESSVSTFLLQDPWIDELRARTRVLSHKTHAKSKGDPTMGIQAMAGDFEQGRIRLPYGSPEARELVDDFLRNEVFPWPDGKRDDVLMALWFIKYAWRSLIPAEHLSTTFARSMPSKIGGWKAFARRVS